MSSEDVYCCSVHFSPHELSCMHTSCMELIGCEVSALLAYAMRCHLTKANQTPSSTKGNIHRCSLALSSA